MVDTSPHENELLALWELEKQQRKTIDFRTLPAADHQFGADPYRVVRVRDRFVGLLRGDDAVVLLDATGAQLSRFAGPASPSALAVLPDGDVIVVADGESTITQLHVHPDRLERVTSYGDRTIIGARGVAVAPDGQTLYIVEERTGRLLAFELTQDGKPIEKASTARAIKIGKQRELGRCHGPLAVEAIADVVIVNCLLDRTLEIRRGDHVQRIQHDGPLWGFDAAVDGDGTVLLAAGGVEDHPLERADGGFGYIDSYVFLYRLDREKPSRLAAINVSEHRALTPKWIALQLDGATTAIDTAGFGGGRHVRLEWRDARFDRAPAITATAVPPGTTDAARTDRGWLLANSLFDGFVVEDREVTLVPAGKRVERPVLARVGELLFFTELMAPWSGTEGKRSRFTCETCHHEGYVDGRVHFTGREHGGLKVHAATRPLRGLFNNAPYFSRALDQTTTQMVHSEFKVANRHNGRDPWFALSTYDLDWWKLIDDAPDRLTAEQLREAFLRFLIEFTHRTNVAAQGLDRLTRLEQQGAAVFRDRCADCHAARLIAEEPSTEIDFKEWGKLVRSKTGPLVWSNAAYAKTGVEPYVHDDGTRVPTLRRLFKKWPYFTNGSAKSLAELLDGFAYDGKTSLHAAAPAAMKRLTAADKAALLAFLELL